VGFRALKHSSTAPGRSDGHKALFNRMRSSFVVIFLVFTGVLVGSVATRQEVGNDDLIFGCLPHRGPQAII
jgi:hypothetical protein